MKNRILAVLFAAITLLAISCQRGPADISEIEIPVSGLTESTVVQLAEAGVDLESGDYTCSLQVGEDESFQLACLPVDSEVSPTPTATVTIEPTETATLPPTFTLTPEPTSTSTPVATSTAQPPSGSLIPWEGGEWYLVGANIPWFSGGFGADFGTVEEWGQHTYNSAGVDAMFAELAADGVNTVRWWVFADGRGAPEFNSNSGGSVTGLDASFLPSMADAITLAQKHNIYITFVLFDHSMFRADGTTSDRGEHAGGHHDLLGDTETQSFIDNALLPMLAYEVGDNTIGTHPHVMAWEIINEPEYAINELGTSPEIIGVPMSDMQKFVARISGEIHRGSFSMVTVGSASIATNSTEVRGSQGNLWSDAAMRTFDLDGHLDFYSPHYYGWMDGGANWSYNPLDYTGDIFDKPTVIGEFAAIQGGNFYDELYKAGYAGGWAWSYDGVDPAGGWSDIGSKAQEFALAHADIVCISCDDPTIPETPIPSPTMTSTVPVGTAIPTLPPTPTDEPLPSPTMLPTSTVAPTGTPVVGPNTSFFDGFNIAPNAPFPFHGWVEDGEEDKWYIQVLNRDPRYADGWHGNSLFYGDHGPNCEAPAADGQAPNTSNSHPITQLENWAWVCANHLMLGAGSDGYGVTYAVPKFLADWSEEEVTFSWDMSLNRDSGRAWFDFVLMPPEVYIAQLNVFPPAQSRGPAIKQLRLQEQVNATSNNAPNWFVEVCEGFSCQRLATINVEAIVGGTSRRTRESVELRVSTDSFTLSFPDYGWSRTFNVSLSFTDALPIWAMHSYTPSKASNLSGPFSFNTVHIDNTYVSNGVPFRMVEMEDRIVSTWTPDMIHRPLEPSIDGDRLYCNVNSTSPQVRWQFSDGGWGGWVNMTDLPMKTADTAKWLDRQVENLPSGIIAFEFRGGTGWHGKFGATNCVLMGR